MSNRIRFTEYRHLPDWERVLLSDVLKEHKLKSNGESEVHSVSVHKGLINQIEHLGRSYAADDTSNYNLVRPFDIVYTKSPTGDYPFGVVKQSLIDNNAIVSPLYGVFEPINKYVGFIIDAYFSSPYRAYRYLEPLVKKGAKNTLQISNSRFLSKGIYLPKEEGEQKAVAEWLSLQNRLIQAQQSRVALLDQHKSALLQLLFTEAHELES